MVEGARGKSQTTASHHNQNINSLHSRYKDFIRQFKGSVSNYLSGYVAGLSPVSRLLHRWKRSVGSEVLDSLFVFVGPAVRSHKLNTNPPAKDLSSSLHRLQGNPTVID